MERALKVLAALALLAGSAADGSPINFNEATGGELGINPCGPVGLCPFQLDFGANRFVGSSFFDLSDPNPNNRIYDFDVVEFLMPTNSRLRIRYEILGYEQTDSQPWTMGFVFLPVIANGISLPDPYCDTPTSTNLGYRMFDSSSGELLNLQTDDCVNILPPSVQWRFGHAGIGGLGSVDFDYRMTLLVTPVPEPGSLALLTLGLLGLRLSRRTSRQP